MKVLIVNTAERKGGAAIAANRLMKAVNRQGCDASMLVRDGATGDGKVTVIGRDLRRKWHFLSERLLIWMANGFSRRMLFDVDIASAGTDITGLDVFKEADIIHLHWINQGMLSLDDLKAIFASGKPVVWTMHDMWPFTGICHHAGTCVKYRTGCHDCPQLVHPGRHDLSQRVFAKKRTIYSGADLTFVGCSRWIAGLAGTSLLTAGHRVVSIPNAVDTTLFRPVDRDDARRELKLPVEKYLLLFGSVKTSDRRKGIDYLIEACRIMARKHPELADRIGVVVFGGASEEFVSSFPYPIYPLDYVSQESELVTVYNAADIYVTPSLQENLPNTIAEAMSCGTPCVGFNIGGIPQMISHGRTGYVAEYRSADDLAAGIYSTLMSPDYAVICEHARQDALENYSEDSVAEKYLAIYESVYGARK